MPNSEPGSKLQRDLELAAEVQRSMLPSAVPEIPGYSFWVYWQPELLVGGDTYDFRKLQTGEIVVLVADAAGKGVAAALTIASLSSIVPFALEQTGTNLSEFVAALNRGLFGWASRVNRFVTLIAVALDPVSHLLRGVNAGHGGGVIRRNDGTLANLCPIERLGMPIGVVSDPLYIEMSFELGPGELVIIYSDGITNAANTSGETYGTGRLNALLASSEPRPAEFGENLLKDVKAFTGGVPIKDDIVVVCFGRDGEMRDSQT
jgi:phosphoserine phosphatase RsbU/P